MSNSPALLLRGKTPTSFFAREPSVIPTPTTAASPAPNLSIRQSCCERVRGVCVLFFLYRRRGAQDPFFRQKTPRPHSKRPGASFYACKIIAPQGVFTRVMTVRTHSLMLYDIVPRGLSTGLYFHFSQGSVTFLGEV